MGESQRANMMGQRVFIIAFMASFCVALPMTDLVVPEAKDARTSGAEFVQSTLKSGGTETQCRTFATDTISSINAGVTSEQGVLAAIDTGAGCAQEGQSGIATATTNKVNADAVVGTKTQAVTDATATQATACNAPVTMVVNLPTLAASTCYDYTQEAQFLSVQGARDAANTALSQANSALGVAQTTATDAQTALDAAVAEAARLMSECHCRVQQERAAAWTAAGTATASHVADWKQAHEVLCALDQTTTCTVPTCPAVTQPAAANGVADEDCSTEPTCTVAYTRVKQGGYRAGRIALAGAALIPTKPPCVSNDDWTAPFCRANVVGAGSSGAYPQSLAIGLERCKVACDARPECTAMMITHPGRGTTAECFLAGGTNTGAFVNHGIIDYYDRVETCTRR